MIKKLKFSFLCYLISGLLITFFLFQTVHNRNFENVFTDSKPRYFEVINFWIDDGFIKTFGLWPRDLEAKSFRNVAKKNVEEKAFYVNDGMGYLHPAYVVQKIFHVFSNKTSYKLYTYQNQLYLILSSIFLSILACRIFLLYGSNTTNSFIMGLVCQLIYLTFPVNLFYYWGAYPTAINLVFITLFLLLIFEINFNPRKIIFKYKLIIAITVFFIAHTSLYIGILFISFYILTCLILNKDFISYKIIFQIIILPLIAALILFFSQLLFVKLNYNPEFVGSSFNYRSGFDGDILRYKSYLNLIFDRTRYSNTLYQWYELMVFSFISLVVYLAINIYNELFSKNYLPIYRKSLFVIVVSLGAYFPYALLFTQSTVIHAKVFDPYLLIPLILITFSSLPAILEKASRFKGLFCLLFLVIGIFLSLINLRLYSIEYPL